MSTFDLLGDLSPAQRTLTRILLRNAEMTELALYKAVLALPDDKRMSRDALQDALDVLVEKGWVFKIQAGGETAYSIKQQKKL